jgi:hypothetical protein
MYSDLLQPNVVETRIACDPLHVEQKTVQALDAVTTCSDDRKRVAIALVNRHPEAQVIPWRPDTPHLELPPHSIAVLQYSV